MVHKTPGTDIWDLAMRSQRLWQMLAENIEDPLKELGWKKTGSLLVGKTTEESDQLKKRVQELLAAGIEAHFMSNSDLEREEPELTVGREGCGAFLPDDCQLDAYRTVAFIEKGNRLFESRGRYTEFYQDPAVCLLRSSSQGKVEGIRTEKNTLYGKKAIIVAAGCWSGVLMRELIGESGCVLDVPVQPRKGYLLMLENFNFLRLNHGVMEAGYVNHQRISPPGAIDNDHSLSISMTATLDAKGNLLIGSSRQLAGFDTELDARIVDRIWQHAQAFFPALKEFSVASFKEQRKVRIGLRPYMPDGKPVIGPVPALPNVFLATGHEGGGLSMALGTAEMVVDMVLDRPLKVDPKPFCIAGRCC
ncbi:D-amino acid dehydrogenase-like protein [Drosera capensis]